MTDDILVSRGATKRFGGLIAVNHIDFRIPRKAIVSIIGPNGAGKTTFFNCITGFYQIDEGELLFDGARIDGLTADKITRLGIARTFQNIRLFNNMTVIENVLVGQEAHLRSTWLGAIVGSPATRRDEADAEKEARRILDYVGLRGRGDLLAK
ncbi:MAG: ATP-binding cassette domain-containing protein, partial [Caldilineaceae bacterium]|nr:ATP-binding cassette domain-containing protein [Caldilineaceae bacterium]